MSPGRPGPAAQHASIGGPDLYVETYGTGPPLLVLHGALMTIELMRAYTDRLAAHRRVIAVELPGHGRTPDAGRPLRYEALADDLAGLLDQLGLARADVFGYSSAAPLPCSWPSVTRPGSAGWSPCP